MTSSALEMTDSENVLGNENESNVRYDSGSVKKVAILLCTYQGQRFLAPQLDSFQAQTHTNWEVWASDDGSKDDTHAILEEYQRKWPAGRLSIHNGPAEGFAANFLSLTCKAAVEADFYAYSDQDDIWEADKIEIAVRWLETIPQHTPALYCSRTRLVDANNKEIGLSPLFTKPPSFANALMQNIGGGNTMIFNNAVREMLRETGHDSTIISHDWWTYILVMACGGKFKYDSYPSVRYRQHNANQVGMNTSWCGLLKRIYFLWNGRYKNWNQANISNIIKFSNKLTSENRKIFEIYVKARKENLVLRLVNLKKSGIYRQTFLGNVGLFFAALLGKI
jgi:glycosyltransferase involved in cell wall biosynthesis